MHSNNERNAMYFYIYVHLDKAKIATLVRLKASSDIKGERRPRLNVERNITKLKEGRFRSRARQPKSFTCIKFHSATTRHEEKKLRRFLEEELDVFSFVDWQPRQTTKRTHTLCICVAAYPLVSGSLLIQLLYSVPL